MKNIDFKLPRRIVGDPPLQAGALKGITVNHDNQIREYLHYIGWTEDGVPRKETLISLGLDFVIPDLYPEG